MIRSISSDLHPSLRWRSRPHRTHSLRSTLRRRFERQQGTRRATVRAHQLPTTVRRPGSVNGPYVCTRADWYFQKGYLVRIHRAWSHFLILSMCIHLADSRPHSLTALAYESITRTIIITSSHAIYGRAGHAPTCVYRLP